MKDEKLPQIVIDTFSHYYQQIVDGDTGFLCNKSIQAVDPAELKTVESLTGYTEIGKCLLDRVIMIKLNGGLGTSMGLTGAKSLLEVKDGRTFLEIIINQSETLGIPLGLMNSFSTHEDTLAALSSLKPSRYPVMFLQHKYPKILKQGFAPAVWPKNRKLEWNPPGHGDIYIALHTSGILDALLKKGVVYAFISNSDNLGAVMDESLLGYFAQNTLPFMMEVAERTPTDMKGGHLARQNDGRLVLREIAQCPDEELDAFQDIRLFRFFNTNNIWVNLSTLNDLINQGKPLALPLIRNPKRLDPRDAFSPEVFQIETAMGAAISLFDHATAVWVPRSRHIPVKKCQDLLMVRSDAYLFSDTHTLFLNPNRPSESFHVQLDPLYYGTIDQFNLRFQNGIPSLVECESLTVEGDVFFEKNVVIKGQVVISNPHTVPATITQGSVIDRNLSF